MVREERLIRKASDDVTSAVNRWSHSVSILKESNYTHQFVKCISLFEDNYS